MMQLLKRRRERREFPRHVLCFGIDPGITGAIAAVHSERGFCTVWDLPIMANGKGHSKIKYQINPAALCSQLEETALDLVGPHDNVIVVLERTSSMPGQGVASMFSMGDSFGACRSVPACLAMGLELITPQSWKKHFNLPPKDVQAKETARAKAIQLYPGAELHLKKHHNRAEALLIAHYFLERSR